MHHPDRYMTIENVIHEESKRTKIITHNAGYNAEYYLKGIRQNLSEIQDFLPEVM